MQRYFTKVKNDNQFVLSKDDMYHIKTVMRMNNNELLEVVYNKQLYVCYLENNNIIIKNKIDSLKSNKVYTVLCLPILQEQKMSFVLQKATELGIDEIIPILTTRSVVKIDGKQDKKLERWNKIVKEASEQSKRLDIPIVSTVKKISDLQMDGLKIMCSTTESVNSLKKELKNNPKCDKIIIVIGPEGGLSNKEEQELKDLNFVSVTLGNLIMRVETVPIYLLSVLNYEMME